MFNKLKETVFKTEQPPIMIGTLMFSYAFGAIAVVSIAMIEKDNIVRTVGDIASFFTGG